MTQRVLAVKLRVTHVWVHKSEIGERRVDITEFIDCVQPVAWTQARHLRNSAGIGACKATATAGVMPQLLLSRVAYGDAGEGWRTPSPFGSIIESRAYAESAGANWANRVLTFSLPMFSRPATAVLDIPARGLASTDLATEWLYLTVVLLLYALAMYVLFRWAEVRWQRRG